MPRRKLSSGEPLLAAFDDIDIEDARELLGMLGSDAGGGRRNLASVKGPREVPLDARLKDSLLWKVAFGSPGRALRVARSALAKAARAENFSVDEERDPIYLQAAVHLSRQTRCSAVLLGHTHLAKRVDLRPHGGHGIYLNTGTWADLMRIPAACLETSPAGDDALVNFLKDLLSDKLEKHIERRPTFAELSMRDGKLVEAQLHMFGGLQAPRREIAP